MSRPDDIKAVLRELRKCLGELPIVGSEQRLLDEASAGEQPKAEGEEKESGGGGRPKVLADGTYATETAFAAAKLESVKAAAKPPLRGQSHDNRFFVLFAD